MTPFSPISGPLVPPLRPPPRCGSRILLASTPTPALASDSAQLHTDLRPRCSRKPARRSPAAWAAQGAGSTQATGAVGAWTAPQGGRQVCSPQGRPASHVSAASPELSPGPAPLTPISEDPAGATRVLVWWRWGSHREGRRGRLPDRRCCIYLAHLKSSPSIPVRCPFSPGVTADHREGTQLRQERSATEPHSRLPTPALPDSRALAVVPARKLPGHLE